MLWILSALHQNLCHWDHNPNLWILIPVTHLDCVSSVFLLDYGSRAILWIVFLVSTLDSVYISALSRRLRLRFEPPEVGDGDPPHAVRRHQLLSSFGIRPFATHACVSHERRGDRHL